MAIEALEISKLSETGEVFRKIRCLAGRITVFRSQSESELESWKRAMEGTLQPERFSVKFDGKPFKPTDHLFIGLGERHRNPNSRFVGQYLLDSGVSENELATLLRQYGLAGLNDTSFADLNPGQERIVRLLAETTGEAKRIIVLHDPFEEIPDKYREPLAERLTRYVWEKKAIIVVTKLSFRPESWIENDLISRAALERPRQRTIGFGAGGGGADTDLIEALRKEMKTTAGVTPSNLPEIFHKLTMQKPLFEVPILENVAGKKLTIWQDKSTLKSFIAMSAIFACLVGAWGTYKGGTTDTVVNVKKELYLNQERKVAVNTGGLNNSNAKSASNKTNPLVAQKDSNNSKSGILGNYPTNIQVAWIAAVENPADIMRDKIDASKYNESIVPEGAKSLQSEKAFDDA